MSDKDFNSKVAALQKIIDESENIVFFGGAGVSTESGIPDFRSTSGLYNQEWSYPPEEIISHTFFYENTKEFYRFYRAKLLPTGFEPNAAHYKLAELEKAGKLKALGYIDYIRVLGYRKDSGLLNEIKKNSELPVYSKSAAFAEDHPEEIYYDQLYYSLTSQKSEFLRSPVII